MELPREYSVWTAERGMSEPDILMSAERLAEVYGNCQMFEGDKIFRIYEDGKIVEEFKCTQ